MPLGIAFWVIFLLWVLFGFWWYWPTEPGPRGFGPLGANLLLVILVFILGWATFGFILQGGPGGPVR